MIKEVKIELTNLCYRNCIHCSSEAYLAEHPYILDVKIVKKIINEAVELGASSIVFTGGEATLYKELESVIEYAKNKRLNTKLYTMCHRNNENIELLKKLSNNGLDEIIYSTTKELVLEKYEEQSLESFIKKLNETTNLKIGFHHVVTNKTIDNIDDIFNLIEKINPEKFTKISFLRYVPHGRGNISLVPSNEEIIKFKEKLIHYMEKYPNIVRIGSPYNILGVTHTPCSAASETLIVGFDGRVYPCDAMKYFDYLGLGGNIYENTLTEIYNSKYFNSIRNNKDFYNETCINCKNFSICKGGCLAQKMIYNFDNESEKTFQWYEVNAKRTMNDFGSPELAKLNAKAGIIGETGELIDCIKKYYTHNCSEEKKETIKKLMIDEIGDLTWYIAASLSSYYEFAFEDLANEIFKNSNNNVRKIDDKLIKYCAICKDPNCLFNNKLNYHNISELDEIITESEFDLTKEWEKLVELTHNIIKNDEKKIIIVYAAQLLILLAKISNLFLGISYEQVLSMNIERLQARFELGFDSNIANKRINIEEKYKTDQMLAEDIIPSLTRKNIGN